MSGENEAPKLSAAERRKAREERQRAKEAEKAAKAAALAELIEDQIEDVEDIREELESKGESVEILVYKTDHGVVAVRAPKPVSVARWRKEVNKPEKKRDLPQANKILVVDNLLYPSRENLNEILEKLPLLGESIASDLLVAAGGQMEADVKKA